MASSPFETRCGHEDSEHVEKLRWSQGHQESSSTGAIPETSIFRSNLCLFLGTLRVFVPGGTPIFYFRVELKSSVSIPTTVNGSSFGPNYSTSKMYFTQWRSVNMIPYLIPISMGCPTERKKKCALASTPCPRVAPIAPHYPRLPQAPSTVGMRRCKLCNTIRAKPWRLAFGKRLQ